MKKTLLIFIISLGYLALSGQPCSPIPIKDICPHDDVWHTHSSPGNLAININCVLLSTYKQEGIIHYI